jgi:hypothetical protein
VASGIPRARPIPIEPSLEDAEPLDSPKRVRAALVSAARGVAAPSGPIVRTGEAAAATSIVNPATAVDPLASRTSMVNA